MDQKNHWAFTWIGNSSWIVLLKGNFSSLTIVFKGMQKKKKKMEIIIEILKIYSTLPVALVTNIEI